MENSGGRRQAANGEARAARPEFTPLLQRAPTVIGPIDPTEPERRFVQAARDGEICVFERGEIVDGVEDADALAARTVRGEVVKAVLAGFHEEWPSPYRRVALTNARIVGVIDLIHLRRRWDDGSPVPRFVCNACELENVYLAGASVEGVEFRNCEILNLYADGLRTDGDLIILQCVVDSLSANDLRADGDLIVNQCVVAALSANDIRIKGRVYLADTHVKGRISFNSADISGSLDALGLVMGGPASNERARFEAMNIRIGGDFDLSGATLWGDRTALNFSGAQITGEIYLREGFGAAGTVNGTGANVEGGIEVVGASLYSQDDLALCLARLETKGCVFLRGGPDRPLMVTGPINLKGARIRGYVRVIDAVLGPSDEAVRRYASLAPKAYRRMDAEAENALRDAAEMVRCLDLERARIESFLEMRDIRGPDHGRPKGDYHFAGAHVAELIDDPDTSWPEKGRLDLDGFTYGSISFHPSERADRAASRLKWLERRYSERPRRDEFRPQPYEELARVFRLLGHGDDADKVAIAKRRRRTRSGAEGFWSGLTSNFMGLVAQYGYSPARILTTMAIFVALGSVAITALMNLGLIEFHAVGDAAQATRYVAFWPWPPAGHGGEVAVAASADGCPALVAPLYALDLTIPFLDLGQESACRLETSGTIGGLVQVGRGLYQILGAILTAITVTTLTGLLRKD